MYAIIDTDGTIYGVGSTENGAREAALGSIDNYLPQDERLALLDKMNCVPCSQALADDVAAWGGNIAYAMVNGVAVAEEEGENA